MIPRNWCKNICLATDDQDIFGFVALMRENLEYQGVYGFDSQPGQSSLWMLNYSSGHRNNRLKMKLFNGQRGIMTRNEQPN